MVQSSGGSFLGTLAQGFMFGTGSAVAHEAIHAGARAMSGGSGTTQQVEAPGRVVRRGDEWHVH